MSPVAPVVEIASGRLRGRAADEPGTVLTWQGIPYAAPPVGARRFAAPQPAIPWAGVREAIEHGPVAVQPPPRRPGPLKVWLSARRSRSEDCLTLGVWAPAAAGPPRPVVVWLHGGSFTTGAGSRFDPTALVARGDVVAVTINYRLGVLGFINFHDALGGDEQVVANPGVLDQQAALHWVRDNIAAFGGDPGRITVAGESAGSTGASLTLVAPPMRGLVQGVIAQSGALTLAASREDAARTGREVLDELGISRERSGDLWRMPASRLLGAAQRVQSRRTGSLATRPWWDGDVLPASLEDAYAAVAPVPLLIGTTLHEHRTFTKRRVDIQPLTRAALATVLTESFGWVEACRILDEYPLTKDGLNDLGSDLVFQMPSVHLADRVGTQAPVWKFRMDYGRGLAGLGAFHGIELMLLFGAPPRIDRLALGPPGAERDALAQRFAGHWLDFVRAGRPGNGWPAYAVPKPASTGNAPAPIDAGDGRRTLIFDTIDRVEADPQAGRRSAWAGRDATVH